MGEAAAYPGLYSLTLGMVPAELVADQVGLNETSNHTGNMLYAVLASLSIFVTSSTASATATTTATATATSVAEAATAGAGDAGAGTGLAGGKFLLIVIGMGCAALLLLWLGVDPRDIGMCLVTALWVTRVLP